MEEVQAFLSAAFDGETWPRVYLTSELHGRRGGRARCAWASGRARAQLCACRRLCQKARAAGHVPRMGRPDLRCCRAAGGAVGGDGVERESSVPVSMAMALLRAAAMVARQPRLRPVAFETLRRRGVGTSLSIVWGRTLDDGRCGLARLRWGDFGDGQMVAPKMVARGSLGKVSRCSCTTTDGATPSHWVDLAISVKSIDG